VTDSHLQQPQYTDTQLMSVGIQQLLVAFSALTLLVGWQEGHPACKKYGGTVKVGTG